MKLYETKHKLVKFSTIACTSRTHTYALRSCTKSTELNEKIMFRATIYLVNHSDKSQESKIEPLLLTLRYLLPDITRVHWNCYEGLKG